MEGFIFALAGAFFGKQETQEEQLTQEQLDVLEARNEIDNGILCAEMQQRVDEQNAINYGNYWEQ